jgi:serpin B
MNAGNRGRTRVAQPLLKGRLTMSLRSFRLALAPTFLLALAGCSASSSPSPGGGGTVVQADAPRDDPASIPQASLDAAVTANNAFAFDLYAHVLAAQTARGNVLTSPISASLALTMTYAGAKGQTASEMAAALHLGSNASSIFDGQNALSAGLESRAVDSRQHFIASHSGGPSGPPQPSADDYALHVVNSVWGEQSYTWEQPFLTTLAKSYGTGIHAEDFAGQPEAARGTINGWVSDQTAGKIQDLLPGGSITSATAVVLVNAIHLKMPWDSPFQPAQTAAATFTKGDGTTVSVPFMNQTETLNYADDGKAQIVSVPLAGNDLSVVFAVPHGDLATYEAGLTSLALPAKSADVALSVPKFQFTSPSFKLGGALQAMGMEKAFTPQAEFQGMCATPGASLYISDVLQKTMIAVQENGVEAAAATAVILDGSAPQTPTPVTLDKPFVVAIVDESGAILFLGHVEDPTDAGGT